MFQISVLLTLHKLEILESFEHWPPGAIESLVSSWLELATSF